MFRIKMNGIKEEVTQLIKDTGEVLELYDPKFSDEDQCSGYHAFREMCLMNEEMCSLKEFDEYNNREEITKILNIKKCPTGFYLLIRIHPNARSIVLDAVKKVREIFAKGQVDKAKIIKKK